MHAYDHIFLLFCWLLRRIELRITKACSVKQRSNDNEKIKNQHVTTYQPSKIIVQFILKCTIKTVMCVLLKGLRTDRRSINSSPEITWSTETYERCWMAELAGCFKQMLTSSDILKGDHLHRMGTGLFPSRYFGLRTVCPISVNSNQDVRMKKRWAKKQHDLWENNTSIETSLDGKTMWGWYIPFGSKQPEGETSTIHIIIILGEKLYSTVG